MCVCVCVCACVCVYVCVHVSVCAQTIQLETQNDDLVSADEHAFDRQGSHDVAALCSLTTEYEYAIKVLLYCVENFFSHSSVCVCIHTCVCVYVCVCVCVPVQYVCVCAHVCVSLTV